ncbi:MAG: HupE/UreJ family protein [Sphingobacteriaceae bacterium]|nr:HupE/UreJ family protein [Sphingobacteriaceae bacterium]
MPLNDFLFYFKLGWSHIVSLDALDHQLFILALVAVYNYKDLKKVFILVTAFTIGHSFTLVLSSLDIFRFSSKWVEFLIPCTIFITAFINIIRKRLIYSTLNLNYYFALGFGLIHGMGFANSIRIMLTNDQSIGWNLFGFNLGLEIGQLLFVAIILLVCGITVGLFRVKKADWTLFVSACVFGLALKMALERFPLLLN